VKMAFSLLAKGVSDTVLILKPVKSRNSEEAVIETIQDHCMTEDPLAIWRNGKVEWVRAEKRFPLKELKKRVRRSIRR